MSATVESSIPSAQPLVVRPRSAMILLNCGREKLYELLNAREIDSYREGAARKITLESIHAYVERKLAAEKRSDK